MFTFSQAVQFPVCSSGCEMTPRGQDPFARRQPPIQPVLDASFLLMQLSGTHGIVKLTDSHLSALRGRSFVSIVLDFSKIARGNLQKARKIYCAQMRNTIPAGE